MDKDKEKAALMNVKEAEAELISPNLAYKPVNFKKEEEKLRHTDPKKATQLERLGMGLGGSKRGTGTTPSGRGHSASAAMETVEQVKPTKTQPSFADKLRVSSNSNMDFFDRLVSVITYSQLLPCGHPAIKDTAKYSENKLNKLKLQRTYENNSH